MRSNASRLVRDGTLIAAVAVVTLLTTSGPASAHEKWFVEHAGRYPTDWGFAVRPLTLTLLAAVVAATIVWRLVAVRYLAGPEIKPLRFLGRFAPYMPRILAVHLGVSLLAAALSRCFLTHDLEFGHLTGGNALLLAEGLLGIWFITGVRLRFAAAALIVIGPFALALTGFVDLLSAADLLGVAAFLLILPPSDETFGRVELNAETTRRALLALRLGVGTALITLAFAEKLANPDLARQTLRMYPALDVFSLVGLHVPANVYVTIAGATEVLFGLLVVSGAMPQLAVLVAGIPFNATLILFGAVEMLGHLPVYGVFATLLVYGSNPVTAPWVRYLPSVPERWRVRRPQPVPAAG